MRLGTAVASTAGQTFGTIDHSIVIDVSCLAIDITKSQVNVDCRTR